MPTFSDQLNDYKQQINADIAIYAAHARVSACTQFGDHGELIMDAFFNMVERGGKRLRGALLISGYQMCGGQDRAMILRAATAIEMIHASLLIMDDIQDRSDMRRGKPTAHRLLETYHRKNKLNGDAAHFGVSLALNTQLAGYNAAQMLIGGLNADAELRAKAMGIISHAVLVTAHGQTSDIMHEVVDHVTPEDIERTLEWKTATYSFLNPLCVGMVLAGAGCEDTDAIRSYALHTGKAFQITDDILGVFGVDKQTGKSAMDDIREGKQTALTSYAFTHAAPKDRNFLRKCLGKATLTTKEFAACQRILKDCGAKQYAEDCTAMHATEAKIALYNTPKTWKTAQVDFLRELADSLRTRAV